MNLQEYIIISTRSVKACTNSFVWTRLLVVVLNSSYHVIIAAQHLISKIVFAKKNYKTSITVSYKHEL